MDKKNQQVNALQKGWGHFTFYCISSVLSPYFVTISNQDQSFVTFSTRKTYEVIQQGFWNIIDRQIKEAI